MRPAPPPAVAQATSSSATRAGAEQHERVLGRGLAAVAAGDEPGVESDEQGGHGGSPIGNGE